MNIVQSKIKILLSISLLGLVVSFGAIKIQAAEGVLVTTAYTTFDQTDFVYENSIKVLADYSGDEVDKPIIVNLITKDQKATLEKQGHTVTVIEENPDLTTYKMFYLSQPEQVNKMAAFGKVYPLATHHVLVKLTNPTPTFADGIAPRVMPEPFLDIAVAPHASGTPGKRLPIVASATPVPATPSSGKDFIALMLILAGIVISGAGIGYYIWRQKQQPPMPELSDNPEMPIPSPIDPTL